MLKGRVERAVVQRVYTQRRAQIDHAPQRSLEAHHQVTDDAAEAEFNALPQTRKVRTNHGVVETTI